MTSDALSVLQLADQFEAIALRFRAIRYHGIDEDYVRYLEQRAECLENYRPTRAPWYQDLLDVWQTK
jgi:hypothetical protein